VIWLLLVAIPALYTLAWKTYDPNRCPECHRSAGHKMDCSHGR
jgi:hypothetical protein